MSRYISIEKAKEIFGDSSYGPKSRDYWIIDDYQNNKDELASVMDVLFNDHSKGFKIYSVTTVEHQSVFRIIIKCNVCDTTLSSYDPFISHNNGKPHKKALSVSKSISNSNPNMGPVEFKQTDFSLPCNLFDQKKDPLEFRLDQTTHLVLGASMLFAVMEGRYKLYTCRLCSVVIQGNFVDMNEEETYKHILSSKHIQNYLEMKHGVQNLNPQNSEFWKIASKYRKESKLLSKILVLKKSEVNDKFKYRNSFFRQISADATAKKSNLVNSETQTVKSDETFADFIKGITGLQRELCTMKDKHPCAQSLAKDSDGCIVLILFIRAVAHKLVNFGCNYDEVIMKYGVKIREKGMKLSVPELD